MPVLLNLHESHNMKHFASRKRLVALICLAATCTSQAQTPPGPSRGELLYTTHCVSCHTTQIHWRDNRQAFDWDSLTAQVRRWQGNAGLAWSDADMAEVSRHLNDASYHYPQTSGKVAMSLQGVVCVSAQALTCAETKLKP